MKRLGTAGAVRAVVRWKNQSSSPQIIRAPGHCACHAARSSRQRSMVMGNRGNTADSNLMQHDVHPRSEARRRTSIRQQEARQRLRLPTTVRLEQSLLSDTQLKPLLAKYAHHRRLRLNVVAVTRGGLVKYSRQPPSKCWKCRLMPSTQPI